MVVEYVLYYISYELYNIIYKIIKHANYIRFTFMLCDVCYTYVMFNIHRIFTINTINARY